MARRRPRVKPENRYDAAGTGRRISSWRPPSSGPNNALAGIDRLRARARDSERNDWAGVSGVQKWTTNLVGVGITPRWEDEEISKRFALYAPDADADGVLDFYGMQALGVRGWLGGGEVFALRRSLRLDWLASAPVQTQLVESEFVPHFDADTWPGMPAGNTIRQGIERNAFGRRVAYWMYRSHPGDGAFGSSPDPERLVRVPAARVAHLYEPTRPGQLRGVSQVAPVLTRMRSSMDMEDAVLDRQKLANLFTYFITRPVPPETAQIEVDPATGLPVYYDTAGKPLVGLEPGMGQELLPGEKVEFSNPPEAGVSYSDYMRTTHMGTAAGQGLPYELMAGDLRDVSDRTLRVALQEFRRFARQRQWHNIIPMLCRPMVQWWARAEVLAGGLPPSKFEAAANPTWAPHGWEYIHPTQDAEGKQIEVEAGFRSRSDVIAERGDDPRTVDAERAADKKRADKLGLSPVAPTPGKETP